MSLFPIALWWILLWLYISCRWLCIWLLHCKGWHGHSSWRSFLPVSYVSIKYSGFIYLHFVFLAKVFFVIDSVYRLMKRIIMMGLMNLNMRQMIQMVIINFLPHFSSSLLLFIFFSFILFCVCQLKIIH